MGVRGVRGGKREKEREGEGERYTDTHICVHMHT